MLRKALKYLACFGFVFGVASIFVESPSWLGGVSAIFIFLAYFERVCNP